MSDQSPEQPTAKPIVPLKRLRLKNWRSMRDVTLEFTPITVFIGANASGKTNILDALYFLREALSEELWQVIVKRGGFSKIRHVDAKDEPIVLEYTFTHLEEPQRSYIYTLTFKPPFSLVGDILLWHEKLIVTHPEEVIFDEHVNQDIADQEAAFTKSGQNAIRGYWIGHSLRLQEKTYQTGAKFPFISYINQFTKFWQLLDEMFNPSFVQPNEARGLFPYHVIDRQAANLPFILRRIETAETFADSFKDLNRDLHFLLPHIRSVETYQDDYQVMVFLRENFATFTDSIQSPTVSLGSSRLLTMITPFYLLNLFNQAAGLVAIEEPDVSIHPLLFENLMLLFRRYLTPEEGYPRQLILSTHNPEILRHFSPQDVRIVERDKDGVTSVKLVNEEIVNIWTENGTADYSLGEIWLTRSLGGVPRI